MRSMYIDLGRAGEMQSILPSRIVSPAIAGNQSAGKRADYSISGNDIPNVVPNQRNDGFGIGLGQTQSNFRVRIDVPFN
jgi:hypothetical protein